MRKIYFIGINGIGMSGLAKIMKNKNYDVKGTDLKRSAVTDELESLGITVNSEHKADNVKGSDMIIASSAIKESNPEYSYAETHEIKIMKRGELLAMLLNEETGIAIAGTHGKTTTTSMMSTVMLSLDPTIVVGGILPEIGSNAKVGDSDYFIAEADESDHSFLYMYPKYSVVTNVEEDHMENYGSIDNIKKAFSQFIDQTSICSIVCIDNLNAASIVEEKKKKIQKTPEIMTYGLKNTNADILAQNVEISDGKTSYDVTISGKKVGRFELNIPGDHNILNSLPVIYLANKLGIKFEDIRSALGRFHGSRRRYDVLYENKARSLKIIDDYAHHPSEIKATLAGARSIEKDEITVIFQPHRYSRVKFLLGKFKDAFNNANELVLLPIYSAGEKDEFGVTVEDLKDVIDNKNVIIEKDKTKIKDIVSKYKDHHVFMFMGAGDISTIAHAIADDMKKESI